MSLVVNNGIYGTIRMHQERRYPGRVLATNIVNPDFVALAQSHGAYACSEVRLHPRVALIGIPFDGLVTFRPGARFGPGAIRQSSVLCRSYSRSMEVAVYEQLRSVDAGDIRLDQSAVHDRERGD